MILLLFLSVIFLYFIFSKESQWGKVVFLFSALILYNGILNPEDEILGFIDHRFIVSFLLIIIVYNNPKLPAIPFKFWDLGKKYAFILGIFLLIFYNQYILLKDNIIEGSPEIFNVLKRFTREAIFMFAVYHIIARLYSSITFYSILKGIYFGIFLAVVSIIFWQFFELVGFKINTGLGEENLRITGLLDWQQNQAAGLFNIVYGYVLGINDNKRVFKIGDILLIGVILLGLLLIASKMGLIVFVIISLVYIFRNRKDIKKSTLQALLILLVFIIGYIFAGDEMTNRIQLQLTGEQDTFSSRLHHWKVYLTDIYLNPRYLIIGNLDKIDYQRATHNTYIQILYNGGIFVFIWTLMLFYKLYKTHSFYSTNPFYFHIGYSLLANFLAMLTGAALINIWLILIIACSSGILNLTNPKENNLNSPDLLFD